MKNIKKGIVKYTLILIISLFAFSFENTYAYNATVGQGTGGTNEWGYYDVFVFYNGKRLTGYCANEGRSLPAYWEVGKTETELSANYNCKVEENETIYNILASGKNAGSIQEEIWKQEQGTSEENSGVTLAKISETTDSATYAISAALDLSKISFTCGAGCSNVSVSGKVLTVKLQKGSCSFTINIKYPEGITVGGTTGTSGKSVLHCTRSTADQDVYALLDNPTNSNTNSNTGDNNLNTQTFSDSIKCSNEEQPNKCDEKTEIKVPTYCDKPKKGEENRTITITAPKDVQYCILNGADDYGNTYKMDDGQISDTNPYCAVYCKEDYTMKMPGAQYTESGSYFSLENTVVKATRTCYATNPKGNSDEPQILIDEFVKNIIAKQKELLAARNAYLKAKLEKELADDPLKTTMKACDKDVGTKYEIASANFTGVNENPQCDNTTGICQVQSQGHSTDSYAWGVVSASENYGTPDPLTGNRSCSPSTSTAEKPDFAGKLAEAEANLIRIQNELKQMTTWMEECYNWVNNLCIDTQVQFDYNEQYSTDINYSLVSGGGTFTNSDATYGTSKNIDRNYSANSTATLEDPGYIYCDTTTCNYSNVANQISTLKSHLYYRKIESNGSAEYANVQEFQTNYPHGTIDTVTDPSALNYNYSYLGAVFPIALNTPTGVYKWTLNFSNLGQYNDDVGCKNGRLDDVIRYYNLNIGAGLEYVCVYVVDCDDCDYECAGEGCIIPEDEKCPECDVYCTNCIFDGDGYTFYYRVIGSEVNPEGRKLGSNWESEKGQAALKEIESDGENIYIEAEYTYHMDASNMKAIRDYNKEKGTYVADDLSFHDVGDIKNAYGTSSFLDSGVKNGFFKEIKRNKNWQQWDNTGDNMGPAWK